MSSSRLVGAPRVRVAYFGWGERLDVEDPVTNPTGRQIATVLRPFNVDMESVHPSTFDSAWVQRNRRRRPIIHLNWLVAFYLSERPVERRALYERFRNALLLAKSAGYRIVWTMHNVYPHQRIDPILDRQCRRLVAAVADAVMVHCREGVRQLERFERTKDVFVIPHGNFVDYYPDTVEKRVARLAVGVPENAYAYLFFGHLAAYKGVDRLIRAFRRLPGRGLRLIVAGYIPKRAAEIEPMLQKASLQDARILFRPGFVPRDNVQYYMRAADAVVLPFRAILNSASLLTALSFGTPVVVPNLGCVPETMGRHRCGVLYEADRPRALERAMKQVRRLDPRHARAAALAAAQAHDWSRFVKPLLSFYGAP
jgi:beta-1,4-mannosyltransferase